MYLENKQNKEGELSKKREKIVERKHLNLVGKKLISPKKIRTKLKRIPNSIYGNTLEALIGAIYLEKGLKETKSFVKKHIFSSGLTTKKEKKDYKGELQKKAQKEKKQIRYKLLKEEGPDHKKSFLVSVLLNEKEKGKGKGKTKKEAQKRAAAEALKRVF